MPLNGAVLAVDGDTWEVAHMLVRARKLVEEGGFATILLSGEGKSQFDTFGQRFFLALVVVDSRFAKAWVGVVVVQGSVV